MSKLARACAVVVCVATSFAAGIAAAQIQGGVARRAAPASVALGVPVAKAGVNQRSSNSTATGSGSSLSFTSGQHALRYEPGDLPSAKDPVRREALKDSAKEAAPSAAGVAAEFAPAPGVLRANMPPVTGAEAQGILKARVFPANLNQGAAVGSSSKAKPTQPALAARAKSRTPRPGRGSGTRASN